MDHFLRLKSIQDVLEMLFTDGPDILLIAGGTDLLANKQRFENKRILLDITSVAELSHIELTERNTIRIGATATHQQIVDNPSIVKWTHLLSLACANIGSFQIRNRGTLGGNLGNASPAADSVPALACLDAKVHLVSRDSRRTLPILELFTGPGKLTSLTHEVIESVEIPLVRGRKVSFFKKIGQRKGMCCSKASVAFSAQRRFDGRLSDVRIALGAVAPKVIRVKEAENLLENNVLGHENIAEASALCSKATQPIDDLRSTANYRHQIVGALLKEGLLEIYDHLRVIQKKSRLKKRG